MKCDVIESPPCVRCRKSGRICRYPEAVASLAELHHQKPSRARASLSPSAADHPQNAAASRGGKSRVTKLMPTDLNATSRSAGASASWSNDHEPSHPQRHTPTELPSIYSNHPVQLLQQEQPSYSDAQITPQTDDTTSASTSSTYSLRLDRDIIQLLDMSVISDSDYLSCIDDLLAFAARPSTSTLPCANRTLLSQQISL